MVQIRPDGQIPICRWNPLRLSNPKACSRKHHFWWLYHYFLLGGSSHLVSRWTSYAPKWMNPTYPTYNQGYNLSSGNHQVPLTETSAKSLATLLEIRSSPGICSDSAGDGGTVWNTVDGRNPALVGSYYNVVPQFVNAKLVNISTISLGLIRGLYL